MVWDAEEVEGVAHESEESMWGDQRAVNKSESLCRGESVSSRGPREGL